MSSYTAAGALPVKLIQDTVSMGYIKDGYIPPLHVQLIPTNHCNLKCNFCSCSSRQREQELTHQQAMGAMAEMHKFGCKSVTITGGGEPLMHRKINDIIEFISQTLKIKVGLVTNGTLFDRLKVYKDATWIRISASDEREPNWSNIDHGVKNGPDVDWAFSYVVTQHPRYDRMQKVVDYANDHKFTHVRLVSDLLDVETASRNIEKARSVLKNDGLVIYQNRAAYTRGRKDCSISLLKPLIGADGGIYPCCGVQYADDPPGKDLCDWHRMGYIEDIQAIWGEQEQYNGARCVKCYYDDYNELIAQARCELNHREFV